MLMPSASEIWLFTPQVLGPGVSATWVFPEANAHTRTHTLSRSRRKWQEREEASSPFSYSPSCSHSQNGVPGSTADEGSGVKDSSGGTDVHVEDV